MIREKGRMKDSNEKNLHQQNGSRTSKSKRAFYATMASVFENLPPQKCLIIRLMF